jgi:hypothetical protein
MCEHHISYLLIPAGARSACRRVSVCVGAHLTRGRHAHAGGTRAWHPALLRDQHVTIGCRAGCNSLILADERHSHERCDEEAGHHPGSPPSIAFQLHLSLGWRLLEGLSAVAAGLRGGLHLGAAVGAIGQPRMLRAHRRSCSCETRRMRCLSFIVQREWKPAEGERRRQHA